MRIFQNNARRAVNGVAFGSDGFTLIAGGSGGFGVWSLLNGYHDHYEYHATKNLYAFNLDPQGRWLYISDALGGCSLFSLAIRKWSRLPGSPHDHHVVSLAHTSDGSRLAVSRGGAGTNRVECWEITPGGSFSLAWALRNGRQIASLDSVYFAQQNWFTEGVAFDSNNQFVATVDRMTEASESECRVHFRSSANGASSRDIGTFPASVSFRVMFTPNDTALIGYEARWLHLLSLEDGRVTKLTPPGRAHFRAAAVHPSGRWVTTVANDGCARFWSLPDFVPEKTYRWEIGKLHSIAFSSNGALAAAGGDTGKVVVWDVDL